MSSFLQHAFDQRPCHAKYIPSPHNILGLGPVVVTSWFIKRKPEPSIHVYYLQMTAQVTVYCSIIFYIQLSVIGVCRCGWNKHNTANCIIGHSMH